MRVTNKIVCALLVLSLFVCPGIQAMWQRKMEEFRMSGRRNDIAGNLKNYMDSVESGLHIRQAGGTDLSYYALALDIPTMKKLLDRGESVDKVNPKTDRTALNWVVQDIPSRYLSGGVIPFLFEKGASCTKSDNGGATPLHTLFRNGYYEFDENGCNRTARLEIMRMLCDRGADPRTPDKQNRTTRSLLHSDDTEASEYLDGVINLFAITRSK